MRSADRWAPGPGTSARRVVCRGSLPWLGDLVGIARLARRRPDGKRGASHRAGLAPLLVERLRRAVAVVTDSAPLRLSECALCCRSPLLLGLLVLGSSGRSALCGCWKLVSAGRLDPWRLGLALSGCAFAMWRRPSRGCGRVAGIHLSGPTRPGCSSRWPPSVVWPLVVAVASAERWAGAAAGVRRANS